MVFIQDIVRGTELTIASGGPPGGLPAATADPRQTPSPAARLAQARQKIGTFLACGALFRTNESKGSQQGGAVRRRPERCTILFRACARRAAGDGVCRGSAVAAGRPPGGPPEAMVSPEHHHSGIDVENKLYTYYRRTRNAILFLNKL